MSNIIIYTKEHCPYCDWAKQLLDSKKLSYQEIRIDLDTSKREQMEKLSGRRTVPQIIINELAIGGYDDLVALDHSGKLNELLNNP